MSGPVHDSTRFSFFDRNLNWSTFNAAGVAVARVPDDFAPVPVAPAADAAARAMASVRGGRSAIGVPPSFCAPRSYSWNVSGRSTPSKHPARVLCRHKPAHPLGVPECLGPTAQPRTASAHVLGQTQRGKEPSGELHHVDGRMDPAGDQEDNTWALPSCGRAAT